MDKETLEEAAKRIYGPDESKDVEYYAFINGAKYQAERMYSEEEVRRLLMVQRGNSYVAILSKTRDEELASIANSAPEPSGKDGWVKKF